MKTPWYTVSCIRKCDRHDTTRYMLTAKCARVHYAKPAMLIQEQLGMLQNVNRVMAQRASVLGTQDQDSDGARSIR